MKAKIYKSLFVLMAIVMVIDWPVGAEAVNGSAVRKVSNKVVQEVKHTSFFRSCVNKLTGKTEEVVNKTTPRAGQVNNGVAGAAAARGMGKVIRNNDQSSVCGECGGTGEVVFDGDIYYCPECQGTGSIN